MTFTLQSLDCPNCGYPLPAGVAPGSILRCEACGTSFSLPTSLTPEPDMGPVLLAADFRGPTVPGWKTWDWAKPAEFALYEGRPEWRAFLAPEPEHSSDFLISTPGPLDDFDVCVSLRFLGGDEKNYFAGLSLRASDEGSYQAVFDSGGKFRVGWFEKANWGGYLVPWGTYPSLRVGLGIRNTLRAILRGEQMRFYLNGVLAASLKDARFSSGKLRVVASPYDQDMSLAVSNLQVRESKPF